MILIWCVQFTVIPSCSPPKDRGEKTYIPHLCMLTLHFKRVVNSNWIGIELCWYTVKFHDKIDGISNDYHKYVYGLKWVLDNSYFIKSNHELTLTTRLTLYLGILKVIFIINLCHIKKFWEYIKIKQFFYLVLGVPEQLTILSLPSPTHRWVWY